MSNTIELNQGEILVNFKTPDAGKLTFADLGLTDDDLYLEGGLLRLVIDLEGIGEHNYFRVPTVEIAYQEEVGATQWVCDFNEETILEKVDHHGHSTVLLLNRNTISSLEHHHQNKLIIHAEFPQAVHLSAANSYVNLFN